MQRSTGELNICGILMAEIHCLSNCRKKYKFNLNVFVKFLSNFILFKILAATNYFVI